MNEMETATVLGLVEQLREAVRSQPMPDDDSLSFDNLPGKLTDEQVAHVVAVGEFRIAELKRKQAMERNDFDGICREGRKAVEDSIDGQVMEIRDEFDAAVKRLTEQYERAVEDARSDRDRKIADARGKTREFQGQSRDQREKLYARHRDEMLAAELGLRKLRTAATDSNARFYLAISEIKKELVDQERVERKKRREQEIARMAEIRARARQEATRKLKEEEAERKRRQAQQAQEEAEKLAREEAERRRVEDERRQEENDPVASEPAIPDNLAEIRRVFAELIGLPGLTLAQQHQLFNDVRSRRIREWLEYTMLNAKMRVDAGDLASVSDMTIRMNEIAEAAASQSTEFGDLPFTILGL